MSKTKYRIKQFGISDPKYIIQKKILFLWIRVFYPKRDEKLGLVYSNDPFRSRAIAELVIQNVLVNNVREKIKDITIYRAVSSIAEEFTDKRFSNYVVNDPTIGMYAPTRQIQVNFPIEDIYSYYCYFSSKKRTDKLRTFKKFFEAKDFATQIKMEFFKKERERLRKIRETKTVKIHYLKDNVEPKPYQIPSKRKDPYILTPEELNKLVQIAKYKSTKKV